MISMMQSFDYMRNKTSKLRDFAQPDLQEEFQNVIPIMVPIFDGTKAISPSMKEWIKESFPHVLDDLEGKSEPGLVDVRVHCSKWWYYTGKPKALNKELSSRIQTFSQSMDSEKNERISRVMSRIMEQLSPVESVEEEKEEKEDIENPPSLRPESSSGSSSSGTVDPRLSLLNLQKGMENDVMTFYMCPIIKKSNHRKHNSHQWFFDSLCEGLEDKVTYAFLTDCGTSYQPQCLPYMLRELYQMNDLIGVTARQRVETPNSFFKPCQESPFYLLRGDHSKNPHACWKCWATFALSPCPLQGFEFEAASILSLAMFNMVEALPVMPGPCQMMNWQKMKQFQVVDEYFNLLFEGENEKKLPQLPPGLKIMPMSTRDLINDSYMVPRVRHSKQFVAESQPSNVSGAITFTEFLRVNMRLAEDRILSFVSVFSTGYGTKWVPGATFYYQPEIQWTTLLTQRRRWINGTFAGYLFYFMSQRARMRVKGGLLDVHKPGRSSTMIDTFFALQVVQMVMVIICPAVFGLAGYLGILQMAEMFPSEVGWLKYEIFGPIRPTEVWIGAYLAILAGWIYLSITAPRGKMPEWLCQILCIYSFIFMLPVYLSIWYTIIFDGPGIVGSLVIVNLGLPCIISLAESFTCAILYFAFLPWFVVTCLFFLVFLPQYSFARLWDTTWGNRATGKDSAINDKVEDFMKRQNIFFSIFLWLLNVALLWAFAKLFAVGVNAIVSFLFVVFAPIFVQMVFSFFYMFVVLPIRRTLQLTWTGFSSNKKMDDLGIDFDEDGVNDVHSGTFFMDSIFPGNGRESSSISLPADMDQRSFWFSPGSPTASQIELKPLIEEDKPSSSTSSKHHQLPPAKTSLHHLFSPDTGYDVTATNNNNELRKSYRMEVAGRYAKV
eukprot:CAMPEP_0173148964 /NCGR_PEP_ID=MMETSP1105-20130129/10041_1 /TAXON_ID=2985 /ORGANISM="Ochromonas sp., Strain BG-1" /LENGTH=890 /DNA_ID=CAMNT_0014063735 /DNA_START=258 /DNA_END=2930 /DNA_ORIENTATION=-